MVLPGVQFFPFCYCTVIRGKAVIMIDHDRDFDTIQKYIFSALVAQILKALGGKVARSIFISARMCILAVNQQFVDN